MLKVADADYIIVTGFKSSIDSILEMQKRKYAELLERYKIREGTCAAALLKEIAFLTPFEDCEDEYIPYLSLLHDKGFERWSKSTLRRSIRRLMDLDAARLRHWDDIEEGRREFLLKLRKTILENTKVDLRKLYDKVLVPTEKLSVAEFEELDKLFDEMIFIPGLNSIYCASEEDVKLLGDDRIISKEDVRELTLEARAAKCMEIYRGLVRSMRRNENSKNTHEERVRAANEYGRELQTKPHIKDIYIAGSLSRGEDEEGSDVDFLLCRDYCPGEESCFGKLQRTNVPVDIFCYTPEEIEELKHGGALITFFSISYSQWRERVGAR